MRFTDSNFLLDYGDSKSVSGYIYILNGGATCWKSFKQHTVVDSTYEIKYIVVSIVAKEAMWLWKFINELGVAPSLDGPILLYYDSTGVIAQVKELKSHQRTKHILCCYHLIQEVVDWGDIEFQKIDRKQNLANPFTKALDVKEFEDYKSKMDIRYCTD